MFSKSLVSSTIAKRIFLFFFLVSAIPIALIAYISYQELSKQIANNLERQVFLDAKLFSQIIMGKFNNAAHESKLISQAVINSDFKKEYIKNYSDIYQFLDNQPGKQILGVVDYSYTLSEQETNFLKTKRALITFDKNDASDESTVLFFQYDDKQQENTVLRFDNDELMRAEQLYCIESFDFSNRICNVSKPIQHVLKAHSGKGVQKLITIKDNNKNYLYYRYPLFMGATYSPADIYVSALLPLEDAYAPLNKFKTTFLSMLFLSLVLLLILSIRQIKQILTPLKLLQHSVEKIKNGDYGSTISLESNDEFQELSETFNEMSSQVHEHFELINSFSELDKIIISNHDFEDIIKNIIIHLREYLNNADIGVFIIDLETNESAKAYLGFELPVDNIQESNVDIFHREIDELTECESYIEVSSHAEKVYLSFLPEKQINHIKLFPLKNSGDLIGILYINSTDDKIKSFEVNELKELASKVSIALTNSSWEKRLFIQANYDGLTGLPNRYLLQDEFTKALGKAEKYNQEIGFLLVDLDRFKNVNDTLGHAIGDQLLIRVATVLRDSVLENDLVARYGGDEFIILVIDTKDNIQKRIEDVVDNIYTKLKQQIRIERYDLIVTPSIGGALYPHDGENFNDLLKNSDAAMYQAKRTGRARFEFYTEELSQGNLRRLVLEKDLRNAIENNELSLYYQPKVNTKTSKIIGMEALLRWKHRKIGFVPPDYFIQLAEETGIIISLTEWILKTACEDLVALQQEFPEPLVMSVNLSPKEFHNFPIVEFLKELFSERNIDPASFDIEITETAAVDNVEQTIEILNDLKHLGVSLSIDDFGTGYSSIEYLQKFPVNILKIDKSFVLNIPENKNNISIVRSIISLAHSLELEVVAEGVESLKQKKLLETFQCDVLQGYYFSQAIPFEEFREYLLINKDSVS